MMAPDETPLSARARHTYLTIRCRRCRNIHRFRSEVMKLLAGTPRCRHCDTRLELPRDRSRRERGTLLCLTDRTARDSVVAQARPLAEALDCSLKTALTDEVDARGVLGRAATTGFSDYVAIPTWTSPDLTALALDLDHEASTDLPPVVALGERHADHETDIDHVVVALPRGADDDTALPVVSEGLEMARHIGCRVTVVDILDSRTLSRHRSGPRDGCDSLRAARRGAHARIDDLIDAEPDVESEVRVGDFVNDLNTLVARRHRPLVVMARNDRHGGATTPRTRRAIRSLDADIALVTT